MGTRSHLPIYIFHSLVAHVVLLLLAGYFMPIHKLDDIRSNPFPGVMEMTEVEYIPPPNQSIPETPVAKHPSKKISVIKPIPSNRKAPKTHPSSPPPAEANIETPERGVKRESAPGRVFIEEKRRIAFNEPQKPSPNIQPQPNTARGMPSPELSVPLQGEISLPVNNRSAGDDPLEGDHPPHGMPGMNPGAAIPDLSASLNINAGINPSSQNTDKQPVGHIESGNGFRPEKSPAPPPNIDASAASGPQASPSLPVEENRLACQNNPSQAAAGINIPAGQIAGQTDVQEKHPFAQDGPDSLPGSISRQAIATGSISGSASSNTSLTRTIAPKGSGQVEGESGNISNSDKQAVSVSNVYSTKREPSYKPAGQAAGIKKPGRIGNSFSISSALSPTISGRKLLPKKDTAAPALPPRITLEQGTESGQGSQQAIAVEDQLFDLRGQINAGVETAFLSINEQVQQLDVNGGNFSARVKLRPGLNNLKISAIDSSGRYASKGVTVNYTPLDISYSGDWTIYVNDALPESQYIYAVISDRYGNKWFGLAGGVARFNGSAWMKYTVLDGLAGNHVRAIAEDTHGGMWFGTEKGVSYFNGSRWTTYNCSSLAGNQLIYRGDNNPIHRGDNNEECPTGLVNAIACGPDAADKVWVGTQEGLFMFNGKTWLHFTEKDGLPHNQINALTLDKSGNLWIGTPSGAAMYDGRNWRIFTVKDGLSHDTVYAIACDIKGKLWFGTEYGVSCFDGQNWTGYTMEDGLSDNQVNAISIDKANNVWFGTDNGVSRFSKDTWAQFNQANGLASDQVNTVLAESNDRIWFGTNRGVTELNTRYAGHTTRR